jgi:hypothetical protein
VQMRYYENVVNKSLHSWSWSHIRLTVSQTCDQILILSEFYCLASVGALSDEKFGLSLVSHCQQ